MPDLDYELRWPVDLFVEEARAVLASRSDSRWESMAHLLLAEAFIGGDPLRDFNDADADAALRGSDPWGLVEPAVRNEAQARFLLKLSEAAPAFASRPQRRAYFAERHGKLLRKAPSRDDSWEQLQEGWIELVTRLGTGGYLEQVRDCQAQLRARPDLDEALAAEVELLLDMPGLWPLDPLKQWDEEVFYSHVEVLHDLVARPRFRFQHEEMPEPEYGAFSRQAGQRLYRWQVNRLLERFEVPLRLADVGEDAGRLTQTVDAGRSELVERALASPEAGDDVAHAIALFRRRAATAHDKRSACNALARVLENRKALIKRELFSKDEDALFEIANRFDIRHSNASQQADYDPLFFDWVFWWYLATVELTDRLAERGSPA